VAEIQPEVPDKALIAGHPGASLLFSFDGSVRLTNPKGRELRDRYEANEAPELNELLKETCHRLRTVSGTVSLPRENVEGLLEVTCIPFAKRSQVLVLCRDASLEISLRNALVESRQRYKDLVEISSDFAWELGPEGTFVFVSPRGALGYPAKIFIGKKPDDFLLKPDDAERGLPFTSGEDAHEEEVWLKFSDDEPACVVVSASPLADEDGRWVGARGVCRDVTEERMRDAALARAYHREKTLSRIVTAIRDEVEPLNMLAVAASATTRSLGADGCYLYRFKEDLGFLPSAEFGEGGDPGAAGRALNSFEDGSVVIDQEMDDQAILAAPTSYSTEVNGAIVLWKAGGEGSWDDDDRLLLADIANQLGIANEQVAKHEHILQLSRTDALTGLLNRRAFFEEDVPRRILRLEHSGEKASLVYVDLDNFKQVNDIHGHQRGDEALIALRDLLLHETRPGDSIARLGGDEFALWLDGADESAARKRSKGLLGATEKLQEYSGDDDHPLGMSIGIAVFDPTINESLDNLVARADDAMYAVKHGGKGNFAVAPMPGEEKQ